MTVATESILKEALKLDPIERAKLIEHLFCSFDTQDSSVVKRCIEEAEDRIDAYERGELTSSPAEDVYRRLGIA
jgi:putative addiction module component (TIGR02574 family)